MLFKSTLYLLLLTTPIWANPEGFYHQEYQYKQSSSSFKNNELQHKKDDEGFYTKDGDLTGAHDPKVNEQHEHREFINPKLRAQGYTEQDFASAGTGMDMHGRAQQFVGGSGAAYNQFGAASGSSYKQNALQSGTTLSSGMQSFMTNLQYDMQRQLERQLQQWRQDQDEYSSAHSRNNQNRYSSTSSGLYSPSTASAESIRRELQEEIRTNLTREIDLRNRIAQTHYDSTDLNDIKQQLQENLLRQLNALMQENQGTQTYPTNVGSTGQPGTYYPTNVGGTGSNAYSTRQQSSSASSSIKTKTANYAPALVPTGNQYSSYEQDDLNRNQQYQQQRYSSTPAIAPDQYVYTPSSPTASRNTYASTMYGSGSTKYVGSTMYENPTPVIRNANQITEIAQQVQNDMQKILITALDQYQHENSFTPSNKYQTKPDYHYARQNFESRLQYNLTDLFQTVLDRNFGPQDLRGQYYFSRGAGGDQQQRYANYKQEDYDRLKQQVTDNLQKFLRDSLKTQEEYYETQQRAYSSSSQSAASYTSGGQYSSSPPHQEGYYTLRPTTFGGQGASRSYSSSSSYSGSAAYQTESRPQRTGASYTKTSYPTGGYRATSDTAQYGTYAKYQGGRGDLQSATGQVSAMEDCDEGMQGDDPSAYLVRGNGQDNFGVRQKPTETNYQKSLSYSEALRKPVSSEEDYQRPVSDLDDYQKPVSDLDAFERATNNVRYYQQPRSSLGKPYSSFYDSERLFNHGRSGQGSTRYGTNVNTPKVGQFSVDSEDYDDDIKPKQKVLDIDEADNDQINIGVELEDASPKNMGNLFNFGSSMVWTPTTEKFEDVNNAKIDEIAQKLKGSVEEFHFNKQQQTLDDDDIEQFQVVGASSTTPRPLNFNHFYGVTEADFASQNEDLLRVFKPYKPTTVEMPSSTSKYYEDLSILPSYTPRYNYFNREPLFYGPNQYYVRTTSTERPKFASHYFGDSDLQQHHLEDSYEELQVHNKPVHVKPRVQVHLEQNAQSNQRMYGSNFNTRHVVQEKLTPQHVEDVPKQSKTFPEDDDFLENVLIRQQKSTNDEEDEDNEDLAQKPVDDNQEVVISSHRGDIDSFAKPNIDREPLESTADLPIRLADVSRHQNSFKPYARHNLDDDNNVEDSSAIYEGVSEISRTLNQIRGYIGPDLYKNNYEEDVDDLQRPIEEPISFQHPKELHPIRMTSAPSRGDEPKPFFDETQYLDDVQKPNNAPKPIFGEHHLQPIRMISSSSRGDAPKPLFDENQYLDDVQRPIEDLNDLQRPEDESDDVQKPVNSNNYDDYDQQISQGHSQRGIGKASGHFVQNGRRLPEIYESLTEAPQVEVREEEIRRHEVKPIYLSEHNSDGEQENVIELVNNSTETQNKPGFWQKFGGKISKSYNNAKQKAREMAERINFL